MQKWSRPTTKENWNRMVEKLVVSKRKKINESKLEVSDKK